VCRSCLLATISLLQRRTLRLLLPLPAPLLLLPPPLLLPHCGPTALGQQV
jgi:hypothetical protein